MLERNRICLMTKPRVQVFTTTLSYAWGIGWACELVAMGEFQVFLAKG